MVDHDNAADGNPDAEASAEQSVAPPGPRRSTWTPATDWRDADPDSLTDDHLANVLAADFERVTHTGAFAVEDILASEGTSVSPSDDRFVVEEGDTAAPDNDVTPSVESEDFTWTGDRDGDGVGVGVESIDVDSPESDTGLPESNSEPPIWPIDFSDDAPPVEAAPTEPISPPIRQSIPTAELASALTERAGSGGDPESIMATLEEQVTLRAQDASEFARWQESMLSRGSPEALAAVETARASFGDIVNFGDVAEVPSESATFSSVNDAAPSLATHTFRVDAVLDSELMSAPAPVSAPVSDIPPPPGHNFPPFAMPMREDSRAAEVTEPDSVKEPSAIVASPEPDIASEPLSVADPEFVTAPPEFSPIPDLVEPINVTPVADPFNFDAIIGGTLSSVDDAPYVVTPDVRETIIPDALDEVDSASVIDDDVADTDRAFADVLGPFPVTSEGVALLPATQVPPFQPVASAHVPMAAPPLVDEPLTAPPAFRVEESSVEPTLAEQRVGRASRLFWLWFAANSSVMSVAFGGAVLALGMSLRQAIVATLIGVAVSFLPLGLGTLAGKWSGQPTMIVSRATFGHLGNILPAVLALLVRVFWGAVLLWFLAAGTSRILKGADLTGPLSETQVTIIGLAVGFLLALVIAFFGYGLIARIQLIFTIISAVLIAGLIVITWPAVNFGVALTLGDGPWILVLTGAVLVFSFVGLVWAVSSADLARYQRASSSGAASMLWSTFGATIPAFVLIAYGAVLAASNPDIAQGLLKTPLDTIAVLIPVWYPVPLIAALAFSLLSGVVISIYSGGFALQATGASMRRSAAVVIVGVAVGAVAILIAVSVGDFTLILRDLATSLAVPIAAWAGIFGAEMMIRKRSFDSHALLKRGGVYSDVNWVNISMLLVASAIGFGLTTSTVAWLGWQGYFFGLLGVPLSSDLAASDLGVFVALVVGILTPIVAGIPGIRRQERGDAVRSRVSTEPEYQRVN